MIMVPDDKMMKKRIEFEVLERYVSRRRHLIHGVNEVDWACEYLQR